MNGQVGGGGVPLLEQRKKVLELCLSTGSDDTSGPYYANGLQYKTQFQEAYAKNWVTDPSGNKVNVFNYIMLSQTYAFNWEQQQAVLNAFYGDMKKDGTPFDAQNKEDCNSFRPRRYLELGGGTHCRIDKVFKEPLASLGR